MAAQSPELCSHTTTPTSIPDVFSIFSFQWLSGKQKCPIPYRNSLEQSHQGRPLVISQTSISTHRQHRSPSWDPHLPPPTRGHHHSQDIFAQSCVCCWTARPAEGTWLQPASLGICPNFTLATLSPAAAEHSQCLKLALAITRKLL